MDIISGLVGLVALGFFMGYITFGASTGEITIEPEAFELSVVIIAIAVFLVVIYSTLFLGFNIYTMHLALRLRRLIKKEQKRGQATQVPQVKELNDYSALPQAQTPAEFQMVPEPQPIYLQPVVV